MKSILADREALCKAIEESSSIKEVLSKLGLRAAGGNYRMVRVWADRHQLTLPEFDYTKAAVHLAFFNSIPLSEVLVKNSTYANRTLLKRRLLREGLLANKCQECGLGPRWNKKPLTLQLDHVNGIYNDNRLSNLQLLCPNCHTQTDSYAGRSSKIR